MQLLAVKTQRLHVNNNNASVLPGQYLISNKVIICIATDILIFTFPETVINTTWAKTINCINGYCHERERRREPGWRRSSMEEGSSFSKSRFELYWGPWVVVVRWALMSCWFYTVRGAGRDCVCNSTDNSPKLSTRAYKTQQISLQMSQRISPLIHDLSGNSAKKKKSKQINNLTRHTAGGNNHG